MHNMNMKLDTWPEIITVCLCVRTLILHSVKAIYKDGTSTSRESCKAYKTAEVRIQPAMGSVMGHISLRVAQWNRKRVSHSALWNKSKQALAQS